MAGKRRVFPPSAAGWMMLAVIVVVFGVYVAFLPNPVSMDDGLRHFAMARLYATDGIGAVGGWGHVFYAGVFTHLNVDPWFLADIAFMPLAGLSTVVALKIYTVICVALIGSAFLYSSPAQTRRLSILWILLLFVGSADFSVRILLARPLAITTAATLFAYGAMVRRQYVWLAIVLAFSVLWSQLFIFPLAVCAVAVFARLLAREPVRGLLAAVAIGVCAGIMLHPHPAVYVQYLLLVFVRIPFLKYVGLGSEMGSGLFTESASILIVMLGSALFLARLLRMKKIAVSCDMRTLEFLVIGLTSMLVIWVRTIDVLWPFLLLLLALQVHDGRDVLLPIVRRLPRRTARCIAFAFSIGLILTTVKFFGLVALDNGTHDLAAYAASLRDVPSGARMLTVEWYALPIYVNVRPDLRYATGIDPSFTYIDDPEASELLQMVQTPIFEREERVVDGGQWLSQLRSHIDGDYLIISRQRFPHFAAVLSALPDVTVLPGEGPLAVLRLAPLRHAP